jgi:hypothetical protein
MARRLRHSVRQIRHSLWLPRNALVYPVGGLWQLGEFFRAEFIEPRWEGTGDDAIARDSVPGGHFEISEPLSDPAYGAALMAMLPETPPTVP